MVAESYTKLQNLTVEANEPIEHIVMRAAHKLHGLRETATVQLRLIPAGGEIVPRAVFSIAVSPAGAVLLEDDGTGRRVPDRSTLTLLTTTETFRRIADGSLSPVQAYLDGQLHLHGNIELGKLIVRRLAAPGDRIKFCPVPADESWQAAGAMALTCSRDFYVRQRKYLQRRGHVHLAGV